jgi:hypothetical protein
MPERLAYRHARWLILAAVALLGVAHSALLPPFEEYDSIQYWSGIQQVADTGTVPLRGVARLSADLDFYDGPRTFDSSPGQPPSGMTYRAFFSRLAPALPLPATRTYRPGTALNYEGQQPPLYFVALAPAYLLARDWSWPSHMLLLRLVSWALAFTGFAIGCRATANLLMRLGIEPALGLLVPAWPLLFPEFFPDLARIGNNGTCLFFVGIAWALILRLLQGSDLRAAAGLGVALGLGLLTKAFFVPITLGVALLFAYFAARSRSWRPLRDIAVALAIAMAIGSAWYLYNYASSGSFMNLGDFVKIKEKGGVLQTVLREGINPQQTLQFLRGMAVMAATFAWSGTWSRALLSPVFTAPVVVMALVALAGWLWKIRCWPIAGQAPLFVAGPFLLGLVYHQIVWSLTGAGDMAGTPGWHLHVLSPVLALAFVLGWRYRRLLAGLAIYSLAFHVLCWATQASFFSGCAYSPAFRVPLRLDPGSCLIDPAHLAVLGEPILAGAALVLAAAAGGAALFLILRERKFAMQPA